MARKHLPIETTVKLLYPQPESTQSTPTPLIRKIDIEALSIKDNRDIMTAIVAGRIDEAVVQIDTTLKEAAIPKHTCTRRAKPWFTKECYSARKVAISALEGNNQADKQEYAIARQAYKRIVKNAKEHHQLQVEKRMLEEAERHPYKALTTKQPHFPRELPMTVWENHFRAVLEARETRPIQQQ